MTQATKPPKRLPLIEEQASLSVGDRVQTPTGRTGRIIPRNADMPNHHLVLFDDDRRYWMLKGILQLAPAAPIKKQQRNRK
ncbi:MAG: hypothetical protein LH702_23200 [Phormidesmis sp. CAN_BIN44]|nr:hypothetical protein [Phormidesmis sp. CAN_BIN44]